MENDDEFEQTLLIQLNTDILYMNLSNIMIYCCMAKTQYYCFIIYMHAHYNKGDFQNVKL